MFTSHNEDSVVWLLQEFFYEPWSMTKKDCRISPEKPITVRYDLDPLSFTVSAKNLSAKLKQSINLTKINTIKLISCHGAESLPFYHQQHRLLMQNVFLQEQALGDVCSPGLGFELARNFHCISAANIIFP